MSRMWIPFDSIRFFGVESKAVDSLAARIELFTATTAQYDVALLIYVQSMICTEEIRHYYNVCFKILALDIDVIPPP